MIEIIIGVIVIIFVFEFCRSGRPSSESMIANEIALQKALAQQQHFVDVPNHLWGNYTRCLSC